MNNLEQIAFESQKAAWSSSQSELEKIRAEVTRLREELGAEIEASLPENRFGEVLGPLESAGWVENLGEALCESQTAQPRSQFHPLLVLLRNAAKVFRDAVADDPARARKGIVRDQLRVGRRLTRRFAAAFCHNLEGEYAGTFDAMGSLRVLSLATLAFGVEPSFAAVDPFNRLLAELDRLEVPDADRLVPDDWENHPLAGS
jgi:hypothetical protein